MCGESSIQGRKKPKNDEDRISDLPEHVISHILSLMPTKDAVRTSVLSKQWEHKWTAIQSIDIDDTVFYRWHTVDFIVKDSTRMIVAQFVERLLLLSQYITSFCLSLSSPFPCDHDRIAAWICAVSKGNVKSVRVDCLYGEVVVLPHSLLLNSSLRNLELRLRCTFKVPARISYPNLKNLNLSRVEIINESSFSDTLTLDFPVLETIKLHNCKFLNVKMVEVHAPELTTFHSTFPLWQPKKQDYYSIKIVSTNLVEFKFSCEVPRKFILTGQQVVCATLSYACPGNIEEVKAIRLHVQCLLNGFSNLKELNISGSLTMVIAHSTVGVSCPVLRHLVRLVVCGDAIYAKGLLWLLRATPVLKFLKILNMVVIDNDYYDCNAVEPVPPCIKDQLVEFEFGSFNESSLQYNLVNFLLKNGRALKKVQCLFPRWID